MKEKSKAGIMNKLKSTAGESISETLVALLIAALALTMLASAISAASYMINTSRSALRTYYEQKENIETRAATTGSDLTLVIKDAEGHTVQSGITAGQYGFEAFRKSIVAYKYKKNP